MYTLHVGPDTMEENVSCPWVELIHQGSLRHQWAYKLVVYSFFLNISNIFHELVFSVVLSSNWMAILRIITELFYFATKLIVS